MRWLAFFRPGDWLVATLGLAFCVVSFPLAWQAGVAEKAVVKRGGELFAELDLSRNREIEVPEGRSVSDRASIAVERPGEAICARVASSSDPGPRSSIACVRAG
jgi:hypothetical protein